MIRHPHRTLLLLGGWLATAGAATAQYPYPTAPGGYQPGGIAGTPARPPVSPYLNITQGLGNPAVNYFNFTRPALQAQQFYQQQQSFGPQFMGPSLASIDVALSPQYDPTGRYPAPTGHPSAFGYFGGYFNSMGTIGAPLARGGQPMAAARAQQAAPLPAAPRR
jgi:hypothetical protein